MPFVITQVGSMSSEFQPADAKCAVVAAAGLQDDEVTVMPFHLESFMVSCHNQATRDCVLAASPIPLAATSLALQPWNRLAHAETVTAFSKMKLELIGIPAHA